MAAKQKTPAQALAWMREVCLALPDTSEGVHYGEVVFKVGGKLFASCGNKRGPMTIVFRIDPKQTEQLLESDPRFQRYAFEKSALWINASDVTDWKQLREFVEQSYRREADAVAPKRTRKAKR